MWFFLIWQTLELAVFVGEPIYKSVREDPVSWGYGLQVVAVLLAWFVSPAISAPMVAIGAGMTVVGRRREHRLILARMTEDR